MKLIGRKRSRSRSRASKTMVAYKRPKVMRRFRKTPLLGPGARQIYAKCRSVQVLPLIQNGLASTISQVRVAVPWQRPADAAIPSVANGLYTYQPNCFDTGRFRQMFPIYQEYAITGVKIEYRPTGLMPTEVNANMVTNCAYNVGVDDYEPTVTNNNFADLVQLPGFKAVKSRAVWTKFISMRRLSKSEHINWQPCGNAKPIPSAYNDTSFSQAWSMLTLILGGASNRFNLGYMKLTWYVKFRGQT